MKKTRKLVLLLVAIFVAVEIPYLFRGLSGAHKWRQADTAAVARNFYQESPDFLKPRVDHRGNKSGITGTEFPVYNYIVFLFYRISGKAWFGWGQLLSLLFAIGSLLLLFKLLSSLDLRLPYEFLLPVSLFLSPLYFRYAACFMPETMSLFMGLSGLLYFSRWIAKKEFEWWCLSWLFFATSILIRPYMVVLCLPILVYVVEEIIKKKNDFPGIGLGISILIPFAIWYLWYCPYLNDKFALSYFYIGMSLKEGLRFYLDSRLWTGMLERLAKSVVGWVLLPFFLLGVYVGLKNVKQFNTIQKSFIFGVPLVAFLGLPIISGRHYIVHPYYLFGALPATTIIASLGLGKLFKKWKKSWYMVILMFIIFMGNNLYTYRKSKDLKNLEKLIPTINEISTRDDLFVVEDAGAPIYLYVINRKGWSVDKNTVHDLDKLKSYYEKGAKFVLRKIVPQEKNFEILNLEEVSAETNE